MQLARASMGGFYFSKMAMHINATEIIYWRALSREAPQSFKYASLEIIGAEMRRWHVNTRDAAEIRIPFVITRAARQQPVDHAMRVQASI